MRYVLVCSCQGNKNIIYERVHLCMYVRVTLILQHISLLTLEGMVMIFLAVHTAVDTNRVRTR